MFGRSFCVSCRDRHVNLMAMISGILHLILAAAAPIVLGSGVEARMTVLESEQRDGYECSLIEYNVTETERVRSYLLIPDGARDGAVFPGLVMLHDHGARFDIGKEKLVRPLASAPENIRRSSAQWVGDNFDGVCFADSLAALGYAVIVPDMLYWGSRSSALCRRWSRMKFCGEEGDIGRVKDLVYEGQRAVYDSLARGGVNWAVKTLEEDAAAARLLGSLGFVDKDRIGCFGWSMGAHRAWLLAAFCPEIRTGVALCWMTLKETCPPPYKASDYSMLIPELRDRYDFPDIARLLAPKPFFFLNGSQDKLFPVWAVERSFSRMQEIYESEGVGGKLRTEFFDGPHHCGKEVQRLITEYLDSCLKDACSDGGGA